MKYRVANRIVYMLICLCLCTGGNVWATIEQNNSLKNFSEVLTSQNDIFRLQSFKTVSLITENEKLINNSLKLVDYRKQHLFSSQGNSYPILSMTEGSPLNIPGKEFSVKGQTKIMKTKI